MGMNDYLILFVTKWSEEVGGGGSGCKIQTTVR